MIINYAKRFGFVHIPRTGGASIEKAIEAITTDSLFEIRNVHAHEPIWATWKRLPPEVKEFSWYCSIRYPWEIMESEYRLIRFILANNVEPDEKHKKYLQYVTEHGFHEYIERQYFGTSRPLAYGGFWKSYCCIDGNEVGVKPIRVTHFQEDFDAFYEQHGLPKTQLTHEHILPEPRQVWLAEQLDKVVEFCYYDMLDTFH